MELYLQRRHPGGNAAGLVAVIALHVAIGLGLLYGLATSKVHSIKPPEITIYPDPPVQPPTPVARQTPLNNSLPVVFHEPVVPIPLPPQVFEQTQPTVEPVLSNASDISSPVDTPVAHPSAVLGVACPNAQSIRSAIVYPAQAQREGLQGDVLARFVVGPTGDILNVQIAQSSNRAFNAPVLAAIKQLHCVAQGQAVNVEMPFSFRLE